MMTTSHESGDDRLQALQAVYGEADVFTTEQLRENFEVLSFGGGICVVRRKSDQQKGSLDFDHSPRYYYHFVPHHA